MRADHTTFWLFVTVCLVFLFASSTKSVPVESKQRVAQTFGSLSVLPDKSVATTTTILFTGDVLLARDIETKVLAYGESYPYQSLTPFLGSFDFVFANFEAPVPPTHEKTNDLMMNFSVAKERLPMFRKVGFTHASLANNHSFDKGDEGFAHTIMALDEVGVEAIGSQQVSSSSLRYVDLQQHRVAVVALTTVNNQPDRTALELLLTSAKRQSDFQVVYIHWGEEYQEKHSPEQEELAHWFVDQGIDLIVGHHPHVVQDVAVYREVPIVYSLGNFIFDQYFDESVQQGLLVSLHDGDQLTMELHPVSSARTPGAPEVLLGREKEAALQNIAQNSAISAQTLLASGVFTFAKSLALQP